MPCTTIEARFLRRKRIVLGRSSIAALVGDAAGRRIARELEDADHAGVPSCGQRDARTAVEGRAVEGADGEVAVVQAGGRRRRAGAPLAGVDVHHMGVVEQAIRRERDRGNSCPSRRSVAVPRPSTLLVGTAPRVAGSRSPASWSAESLVGRVGDQYHHRRDRARRQREADRELAGRLDPPNARVGSVLLVAHAAMLTAPLQGIQLAQYLDRLAAQLAVDALPVGL